LVVNAEMRRLLRSVKEAVELVDEKGHPLGEFIPEPVWDENAIVPWDPSITKEDLDRIAAEPGGKTLEEIWRDLGVR
jgi:hypothetical protein